MLSENSKLKKPKNKEIYRYHQRQMASIPLLNAKSTFRTEFPIVDRYTRGKWLKKLNQMAKTPT